MTYLLSLIGNSLNIRSIWVIVRRNTISSIPFFVCLLKINNTLFNFFTRGVCMDVTVICGQCIFSDCFAIKLFSTLMVHSLDLWTHRFLVPNDHLWLISIVFPNLQRLAHARICLSTLLFYIFLWLSFTHLSSVRIFQWNFLCFYLLFCLIGTAAK